MDAPLRDAIIWAVIQKAGMMMKETLETCGFPVPTSFAKQLEGQLSLFDPPPALEG